MADQLQGSFGRWEWNIGRDDDGGPLWRGTIKQTGNAAPQWLSYEHGLSPENSRTTVEGSQHPELTSDAVTAEIWPEVDSILRRAGTRP